MYKFLHILDSQNAKLIGSIEHARKRVPLSSIETISKGKVKSSSSRTSQEEEGLLESKTECNIVSDQVNPSNCR